MAVVVAVATPVLAHEPVLSGVVQCAENDQQVITWTLTHKTARGRSMAIKAIELTRGSVVGFKVGDVLPPPPAQGSTVTGTTTLPGDATGSVTLKVTGRWQDENGNPAGPQNLTESATVELVPPCVPPAKPAANIEPSCTEGGALVTVTNTGGTATDFTVFKDGSEIDTIPVPAGGSVSRAYPMTEGETASFRATAPEDFDTGPKTVTFNCAAPASPRATIASSCTDGGALVTLTNSGGKATVFDVVKDGTSIDQVQVAPGGSVARVYPMNEDQTSTFRATAPGYDTGPVAVTFDCVAPARVAGELVERNPAPAPAPTAAPAPAPAPTAAPAPAPAPTAAPAPAPAAAVASAAASLDELPRTGTGSNVLLAVGITLVALGTLLSRVSRPRRALVGQP